MASIFGDDGVDDLFNDNLDADHEHLPSDGEHQHEDDGEKLFAEDDDGNDEAAKADGDSEQGQKVEPKKRAVRNPRPRLTVDTLRGPRGVHTIEDYFQDMQYKGKGYEKGDLDEIMRRLQHWGHRMYPNYTFDDVLNNIERLGKKKPLQVHMARYRLGQLESMRAHDAVLQEDVNDDENYAAVDEPFDEFDALLGEQIAMSRLAPRTPAANRHSNYGPSNTPMSSNNSEIVTPSFSRNAIVSTPFSVLGSPNVGAQGAAADDDLSDYAQPLPSSQPQTPAVQQLTAEQIARIAENRRLALERLRAKQPAQQSSAVDVAQA